MYKVFVNDCPIIFTEDKKFSTSFKKIDFKSIRISDLVEQLFQNQLNGICLLCDNLEESWRDFQSNFKIQEAAGGKVLNSANEVLFILRFSKWDLPKGKLEKGESIKECALREVEEECGINGLKIEKQLETTYHIYKEKGAIILKITYWFLMRTNYQGVLKPQEEEGIEQVVFKNEIEIEEALNNTYENIKLLF